MINLQWDSKFELGHEKIDFEHQIFLDLIRSASELSPESEKVSRILKEVEKYAEFHFLSEENVMIDCGYPDYINHKEEHKRLIALLREHIFKFNHQEIGLEDVVEFLFQWFALHTTQVDSKLTRYIKEHSSVSE